MLILYGRISQKDNLMVIFHLSNYVVKCCVFWGYIYFRKFWFLRQLVKAIVKTIATFVSRICKAWLLLNFYMKVLFFWKHQSLKVFYFLWVIHSHWKINQTLDNSLPVLVRHKVVQRHQVWWPGACVVQFCKVSF